MTTTLDHFAQAWGDHLLPTRRTLNIMVDVDDVLFPWAAGIHERCRIAGLHDGSKPFTRWEMWMDYGCTQEEWGAVVSDACDDGFYLEPPDEEAVKQIRRLHWAGQRIHLVTARGFMQRAQQIREWTHEWVQEYAIPHETLTFAKDKVAAQETLGVRFDFAIDDGGHNYMVLNEAGIRAYLLDQPHNRNIETDRRLASVEEFVDIVLKEAGTT